jgi:hypothetical protein
MVASDRETNLLSIVLLDRTWAIVRRPFYRMSVVSIFLLYGLAAMLLGGMLFVIYPPEPQVTSFAAIVTEGHPWWNYPAVLVETPEYILALPFFGTVTMVLVSLGVAVGMTAAVHLGVQLVRERRRAAVTGTAGAGALTGFSPALIGLVTLGACCSTTAAALAGLTWTATVTGTTVDALLINTWYPGVFQLVVLYIALVAQEQLLRSFGWLFEAPGQASSAGPSPPAEPPTRRRLPGLVLRATLLIGGVTWLLALPAEWTQAHPPPFDAGTLVQAIGEHFIPGAVAVGAALFPAAVATIVQRPSRWPVTQRAGRWLLGGLGLLLATWTPAPLAGQGVYGWGNELVGALGGSGTWAAGVAPPFDGLALAFRWGLQFLVLGGFLVALAARPESVGAILWSSGSDAERATVPVVPIAPSPGTTTAASVPFPPGSEK